MVCRSTHIRLRKARQSAQAQADKSSERPIVHKVVQLKLQTNQWGDYTDKLIQKVNKQLETEAVSS